MLNRRDAMIRLGEIGLGSVTLPGLLRAEQDEAFGGQGQCEVVHLAVPLGRSLAARSCGT